MSKSKSPKLSTQFSLSPEEKLMEVGAESGQMFIGIPKDENYSDGRVALTPLSSAILVNRGHRIIMESNAGVGSNFYDNDYSEAGVEICDDGKKVFEADIILKVTPPKQKDLDLLKPGQTLISPLQLPTMSGAMLQQLKAKKITCIAFEYLADDTGVFPIVRAMSEIAGSSSILIASELLSKTNNGKGILLGGVTGVPPAKVVILGGGVVGEYASRAAMGLGAEVKVFDNSISKLMRMQNNLESRVFTSTIDPKILSKEMETADVMVGAIHSKSGRSPIIVTESMVAKMKKGSVIIDISIDQGGLFETSDITTLEDPTFIAYDVVHYCVPNIAARVARTSSKAVSNILSNYLLSMHENGGLDNFLQQFVNCRQGIYLYKGALTNKHLSEQFDIKFTSIDLLLASVF